MNTQDQTPDNNGIFALFKGPSGAGKSVGALSFPDPEVFDIDVKMPSIARKHFRNKSIEYNRYDNMFEIADKLVGWQKNNNCPHETIIFDSLTSLARLILNSVAEVKQESTPQMLKTMQATKSGKNMIELMGYDYYNAEVRFIDWILSATKKLYSRPGNPKNVIFIAHIITTSTKPNISTGLITVTRSIFTVGNKACAIVPAEFDEVYLFGTQEMSDPNDMRNSKVHHIMTSETSGEDDAKTALNINKFTDFTDGNLYDLLQAQIAGKELFL